MNKKIPEPVKTGFAKTPFIMQMESLECGAAALAMVLAYYGKYLPLEKIRADCGISRDGSNAQKIVISARNYGMIAHGFEASAEEIFSEGQFPCILHWNLNHFVVCNGFRKGKVSINDPEKGNQIISLKEFKKHYTGICIMLEPGEDFVPEGKREAPFQYTKKRLKNTYLAVIIAFLTSVVTTAFNIGDNAAKRFYVDYLITGKNNSLVTPFIVCLGIMYVLMIVNEVIKTIHALRLNGRMAVVSNATFMWHVLNLPVDFFLQRTAGDVQLRQKSNAIVASGIINNIAPVILNFIMIVFYFAVMLRYNVKLTLLGVFAVVLNIFVSRAVAKARVNVTRLMMQKRGRLTSETVSGIDMIETIKANGAERGWFSRWAGLQASHNIQVEEDATIAFFLDPIPEFITELINIAILCTGVYLIMEHRFTLGTLTLFQGFLTAFTSPASMLIGAWQKFLEVTADIERIDDVMNYPTDKYFTDKENTSHNKLSGRIDIKNVSFSYSAISQPVINNVSLSISPGEKVAFVGPSGCGKSTMAKLISGLYSPASGEILFDKKPFSEIDRDVFTGSVAVVDQDIVLFEDTFANNIKMWDDSIEDFEIILAGTDAHIHDDIMKRTGGYNSLLCENGKNLSGGQKQRIEIARVLAQDPTVIILDEATSALDAITESKVVDSVNQRGITCIIIAHRLSAIRDCDKIYVFDKGSIKESGTHEELLALNGRYAELVGSD